GLSRVAIEDDDAGTPSQAGEEIRLTALVVVEPADDAGSREREVRLSHPGWKRTVPAELAEPAAVVLERVEREPEDAVDHRGAALFAPVSPMRRPISPRCCQCFPASSHQPSTRKASRRS